MYGKLLKWKLCKIITIFISKTDVLLLADVFENFRDVCQENYGLDPAWYYTAPGLAWDAALKVTKVELESLADPDMLFND